MNARPPIHRQTGSPMSRNLEQLRNLGPRCAAWLAQIGIHTEDDLRRVGAATAYRELVVREMVKPHRMLLYALGGALEDVDCVRLSREQKRELEEDSGVIHRPR